MLFQAFLHVTSNPIDCTLLRRFLSANISSKQPHTQLPIVHDQSKIGVQRAGSQPSFRIKKAWHARESFTQVTELRKDSWGA